MFATVFYGVLDADPVCSSTAAPGIRRRPSSPAMGPGCSKDGGGTIIGAFPDATFDARSVALTADQVLVLYTDGIIEARADGEFFGEEKLVAALDELRRTSLDGLPDRLVETTLRYTGGTLSDDAVVMTVSLADDAPAATNTRTEGVPGSTR